MKNSARKKNAQTDFDSALDELGPDELKAFLRAHADGLDVPARSALEDALADHANRSSGWRPRAPAKGLVAAAAAFLDAARTAGQADPARFDDLLRNADRAFRAGDVQTAKEVYELVLAALAGGDVYLGEDELVDEVLQVSLHDCARRLLVATWLTTHESSRCEALHEAIDAVSPFTYFIEPLAEMEEMRGRKLPGMREFLPSWIAHLEKIAKPERHGDDDATRWRREAVHRLEGVAGLERMARASKRPQDLRAWCRQLVAAKKWREASAAFASAATLVGKNDRGEFLDGIALAATKQRRDAGELLERAWREAPSFRRLLRWLGHHEVRGDALQRRSRAAFVEGAPSVAVGLLELLSGDVVAAAKRLAKAPGLGWSRDGHPGHVLFPALVCVLGGRPHPEVAVGFDSRPIDLDDVLGDEGEDEEEEDPLPLPSVSDLLGRSDAGRTLTSADRSRIRQALQSAARARTDGVLREKRRRHYDHAASLLASWLAIERHDGARASADAWIAELQKQTSRFSAFQASLRAALR